MAGTKTEEPDASAEPDDPWARYERIKLPPERVAELRLELQRRIDKARADGVYERLMQWKTRRVAEMAETKTEEPVETSEDRWSRYERMKLTPEQVAEARAELQKDIDRARAAGVYEELLKWEGKVHWDIDLDELREDRD